MRRALTLTAVLVIGCGDGAAPIDSQAADGHNGDGAADHSTPDASNDATAASYGHRTVGACQGLAGSSQVCDFTYQYTPGLCAGKCSKLVIYFSGGQMSCPEEVPGFNLHLKHFADAGYIAVCARVFEDSVASASVPRHQEAVRYDALVQAITSDATINQLWTGEHLLFSGVSHGASGPVVAMARNTFDESPAWQGSESTAACFYDGTYDPTELLVFLDANECQSPVHYERVYSRYCAWSGELTDPNSWPAPSTCDNADVAQDTVDGVATSAFAIKDWLLIECGSALINERCSKDVLPKGSLVDLCQHLDGPNLRCDENPAPTVGHLACGAKTPTLTKCSAWFDALVSQQP